MHVQDPMQLLEEEMDKEDIDIFGVEDVCDMKDGYFANLLCHAHGCHFM